MKKKEEKLEDRKEVVTRCIKIIRRKGRREKQVEKRCRFYIGDAIGEKEQEEKKIEKEGKK